MSTGPTSSLRLEKMAAGSNLNTWGEPHLNTVFDLIDAAIAGQTTKALTGNYTLTSTNYAADEARSAILKFTGTGAFTVTIPSVSKVYLVANGCSGDLTITTGGATNATVRSGEVVPVYCDGGNVYRAYFRDMGSQTLQNLANPSNAQDAATKYYVDAQAWAVSSAVLPGQLGSGGKFLTTDGTNPSWAAPTVSQISDYATDQATKTSTATRLAFGIAALL